MSVVIASNELRSIEKADIVISVPLQEFNSMEYNRADELISAGYQAAQAKAALLNTLSVDELTWQAYLTQRSSRRRTSPVPQFVEVVGTSPKSKEAIEKDLKNNIGTPVDTERLQNQLMTIKGNGRFSTLAIR